MFLWWVDWLQLTEIGSKPALPSRWRAEVEKFYPRLFALVAVGLSALSATPRKASRKHLAYLKLPLIDSVILKHIFAATFVILAIKNQPYMLCHSSENYTVFFGGRFHFLKDSGYPISAQFSIAF